MVEKIDQYDQYLDKKIIKNLISKNEIGIELLIEKYGPFIKSIVYHKLGNKKEDCEECINDIYLSIWKNINQFDFKRNSLKNWIAGICRYKTIDYMRKIYRELERNDINSITEVGQYDSNLLNIENNIYSEIERLLDGLSDEEKKLIIDVYINDISIDSISKILIMDKKSIYNKIYYIKSKLKMKRGAENE